MQQFQAHQSAAESEKTAYTRLFDVFAEEKDMRNWLRAPDADPILQSTRRLLSTRAKQLRHEKSASTLSAAATSTAASGAGASAESKAVVNVLTLPDASADSKALVATGEPTAPGGAVDKSDEKRVEQATSERQRSAEDSDSDEESPVAEAKTLLDNAMKAYVGQFAPLIITEVNFAFRLACDP